MNGKKEVKKMMNLEQMKKTNGHFEMDGKEYVLTQEAYRDGIDGNEFTAIAICLQDEAEDGWQPAYRVTWEVIGDDEDDGNNADWYNPCSVVECADYNITDGRIC